MHLVQPLHRFLTTSSLLLAAGLVLAACGGDGGQDDPGPSRQPTGAPDASTAEQMRTKEIAHAAIPEPSDLPGPRWTVNARNQFNNQSAEEFVRLAGQEPVCRELAASGALGTLFGGDSPRVGRAQIELQSVVVGDVMPASIEISIEVPADPDADGAAVAASAGDRKRMLLSDQAKECLTRIVAKALKDSSPGGQATVVMTAGTAVGAAPRDGAASTYDIHITDSTGKVEMRMSFYSWSQGRAAVEVLVMGPMGDASEVARTEILAAIDTKVAAAVSASK